MVSFKQSFWRWLYAKVIANADIGLPPKPKKEPRGSYEYTPFAAYKGAGINSYACGLADHIPDDEILTVKNALAGAVRFITRYIIARTGVTAPPIESDESAFNACYSAKWEGKVKAITAEFPEQPESIQGNIDLGALVVDMPWCLNLSEVSPGKYIIDTSWMKNFDSWDHLLNPACTVHFTKGKDNKLKLDSIEIFALNKVFTEKNSTPEELFQAKRIVICSMINYLTQVDHFTWTHLSCATMLCIATRNNLSPEHPVRWLLQPHAYGTLNTNMTLGLNLFSPGGAMEAILCFPNDELHKMMDQRSHHFRMENFDPTWDFTERRKIAGLSPGIQDAMDIFEGIRDYVRSYMKSVYPTDKDLLADEAFVAWLTYLNDAPLTAGRMGSVYVNLEEDSALREGVIRLMSILIFTSSVRHEIVGTSFVPYVIHPSKAPPVVYKEDPSRPIGLDRYQQTLNSVVTASIEAPPLVSDFTYMVDDSYPKAEELKTAMRTFQARMKEIDTISRKDKNHYRRLLPSEISSSTST